MLITGVNSVAHAQTATDTEKAPKKKATARTATKNPAFEEPEINPTLPNVLLLGDSISIGYMVPVRKKLAGVANVFRPATNCGPTTNGLVQIDKWVGDRKWDVIHFNFGLHDLKYMGANDSNLADPKDPKSHQQVPVEQYAANLKRITERLKQTGAKLIWCQTTPVPEGSAGRIPGDEIRYNEAALRVMKEIGGIEVDDLHAFTIKSVLDEQRPANVHFTEAGSDRLADQVATSIKSLLTTQ
jgi:acyl-CoA thioesterase-1